MILDSRECQIVHMPFCVFINDSVGRFVLSGDTESEAIKEYIKQRTEEARLNPVIA